MYMGMCTPASRASAAPAVEDDHSTLPASRSFETYIDALPLILVYTLKEELLSQGRVRGKLRGKNTDTAIWAHAGLEKSAPSCLKCWVLSHACFSA